MAVDFKVNGRAVSVDVPDGTRLLWVLRERLKLTGTKYGCGVAQCGACMVHVDGQPTFSCQTPTEAVRGRAITTIEGLSRDGMHPVQRAWLAERVPQCGYCQSGQIMNAAALLARNPRPTRAEIIDHMQANICRCGTYQRIVRAIERAVREPGWQREVSIDRWREERVQTTSTHGVGQPQHVDRRTPTSGRRSDRG